MTAGETRPGRVVMAVTVTVAMTVVAVVCASVIARPVGYDFFAVVVFVVWV